MENSIWTKDMAMPAFPTLKGDLKTDVLIIGGGLAGLLCAWELTQRGVDCVLLEADRICHGVTRNTTAKITSHHGLIYEKLLSRFGAEKTRAYWDVNEKSIDRYAALAESIACDFSFTDNYIYSRKPSGILEKEMEAMRCLGIPFEFTKSTQLPFPVAGAIRTERQAQFHPLKLAAGIVKDLKIYEHTKVQEFTGKAVKTKYGKVYADKILVATHFPVFNKHGGYFLKLYQQRSYVLALENTPELQGMYLDGEKNGLSFRSCGNTLLLGGGGHRTGKQGGGWEFLRNVKKQYYPDARESAHWANQDCMTLDGVPYIGQYGRETPNVYVATGFNKWGMTTSMTAAQVLSDLMEGRETAYTKLFSPQRSSLHPQLFANVLESTWNLITPTVPRCPHLGCALKWNPQEHSWDCPCHGSRFDSNGRILDGPATGDLDM